MPACAGMAVSLPAPQATVEPALLTMFAFTPESHT